MQLGWIGGGTSASATAAPHFNVLESQTSSIITAIAIVASATTKDITA